MNVLFIFDDGDQSSFFLYNLKKSNNRLVRFSPELVVEKQTLGKIYQRIPIDPFLQLFSKTFSLNVQKYLILKKADSLRAVAEAGIEADSKIPVTVYKEFTAVKNNQHFKPGQQRLSLKELDAYISYQIDDDGRLDVFERQEDIIRLMKQKTVRPKLSSITKNYGTVKEFSGNNLSLTDMLKMGTGYLAKGSAQMDKLTIPVFGTYQLAGEFPYQINKVNMVENVKMIRQKLL